MANPILPFWEYIPDGEPRVFGDRVYLYGSHDRVGCGYFCDYKLKVWSAPVNDLNHWQCHGTSFRPGIRRIMLRIRRGQITNCMRRTVSRRMVSIIYICIFSAPRDAWV